MKIQGKVTVFNIELKSTTKGEEYVTFNSSFSKKKGNDYVNGSLKSVAFGYTSEKIKEAVDKDNFYLVGNLEPNNYTDQNGEQIYSYQFVVYEAYKLQKKEDNSFEMPNLDELPF